MHSSVSADQDSKGVVAALAGRRIDAPDVSPPRFPVRQERVVQQRIRELFERLRATGLVSSAACGADIVALEIAGEMGIRRLVVLPFARGEFRKRSVVDRDESWGPRFDRLLKGIDDTDIIELALPPDAHDVFTRANEKILELASSQANAFDRAVVAVIVWEGRSRGEDDNTEAFALEAQRRAMRVEVVLTT
jgi:hypothetical protein